MKILAADTSTATGSVALLEGRRVIAEWILQSNITHNRLLLKNIDFVLQKVGWTLDQVEGFAVTTGPGSFTGLRIGLTTLKTLAWTLQKPYAGIPSLDALAAPFRFSRLPVCSIIDARKKEVYCAFYQPDGKGFPLLKERHFVLSPERVPDHVKGPTIFCGDGWLLYRDILIDLLGDFALEAPAPFHVIRASFVAELAHAKFQAGEAENPMASVPLYVRPSEAEIQNPHLTTRSS
ncbi:tRNA (adenosine(37)-N6)-threonylcarbamoyltransferase complex dimerization subunit type 1 TsaB [Desulforhabdus amnigena]|uniref:tRNA (Adenosine(37)-N6)-threonylcarbamoyltransferase complex dimerization subunit type 1 TsaB n=1 Tax=Desulforhabdus amnigena TaxID=40218 RepID=A0A9W6L8Q2_9BACT|nr:tRNA (adenosine(37)-N6)-threonylcarbamoyltransferase complex dimerization subunit type 1 TsaB [Desulforhabdus amnigena]NLJ28733.1 tRNA (adenosine(37)-N6)-threonylcarbamoyltransferase complex dimerization subunit type 1 TsaB [Deltaproteobacteria bacterium]GLI34919.1 tRNA (adenosine(37)-N6)-threonylcarbamoyltransferase complex dimerization subunit type 1 TsaB [Desulforhabdus amnigena]